MENRLEDGKLNAAGLSSPRISCCFASFRRQGMVGAISIPRVQEPAAIRLRLRVFQTPIASYKRIFLKDSQLWKTVWKTGS